jgi:ribosomal protein S18 acetylase RimI-like enzyme
MKIHYTKQPHPLYVEGWRDIIENGYHDPIHTSDQDGIHHLIAKVGRKNAGILSFYRNEIPKVPEAYVMLLYTRPEFRRCGVARALDAELTKICAAHGMGSIAYGVNTSNHKMNAFQRKTGNLVEFFIYQRKVDIGQ